MWSWGEWLEVLIHCLFLHLFFFQMWSWGKWLKVLMDPEPVWQFQSYFGVQKVGKTSVGDPGHFDPDPYL
jgi:hypothetical protein